MPKTNALPLGIRNHNPGNLRGPTLPHMACAKVDGFVVFRSTDDGLANLAHQVWLNYKVHRLHTVAAFVGRYAPASENNTLIYSKLLCSYLRIDPADATSKDTHLDQAWRAFDMMRGIIHMECGNPPSALSMGGEWFTPLELSHAIERAGGFSWAKTASR